MEEKESDVEKASDTESELDFDPETYEKTREEYLRKIIVAENYYHEIRVLVRERRNAEIRLAKARLADGTHPELVAGIKEIEESAQMARWSSDVLYKLQMESRERKMTGQQFSIKREQEENMRMLQEKMRDFLRNKITEKTEMQRNYEAGMRLLTNIEQSLSANVTEDDVKLLAKKAKKRAIVSRAAPFELELMGNLAEATIAKKPPILLDANGDPVKNEKEEDQPMTSGSFPSTSTGASSSLPSTSQ